MKVRNVAIVKGKLEAVNASRDTLAREEIEKDMPDVG